MMSRNSENHTNNSEQNVYTVTNANTIATELTAISVLSKQRKKRKKRKDKLLLTNTIAHESDICSCGKHNQRSCNSISTCSNCVSNACVYCHLNGLACCEHFFQKNYPASSFQCDFHNNIQQNSYDKSLDCWPNQIDNQNNLPNNNNQCNDLQNLQFRSHPIVNRHIERFAVYENLCEFCGFAIGNGSYHLECERQRGMPNVDNKLKVINDNVIENIYENICETCHLIFDGEKCRSEFCNSTVEILEENSQINSELVDVLIHKKPTNAHRQFGKQFTDFLGSFKQKLTPKPNEIERKKLKIDIVHNVGEVFKTNKTFDLNEIVELKNQTKNLVNSNESSAYGKLRNSNDNIRDKLNKSSTQIKGIENNRMPNPNYLVRTSTSDSNFLENYHFASSHLKSPFSESVVSDTVLYSNSYAPPSYEDAIQNSKYASVTPFILNKKPTYDSTSASSFFTYNSSSVSTLQSIERKLSSVVTLLANDSSLKQWFASLKYETFDYNDDYMQFQCDSIKCVPSRIFSRVSTEVFHRLSENSIKIVGETGGKPNLQQQIQTFKANVMEQRMKLRSNAIHTENSNNNESIENDISNKNILSSDSFSTHNNSLVLFDTNSNHQHEIKTSDVVQIQATVLLTQTSIETVSQYLQMLKTFYMTEVTLSTSLNRITLVCGDKRVHFIVKQLLSSASSENSCFECPNKLVKPTKYINFQQIIETIHKMSIATNSISMNRKRTHCSKTRRNRNEKLLSLNDFLIRSSNLLHEKEIPLNSNISKRTIDDFVKPNLVSNNNFECVNAGKGKTIEDFGRRNVVDVNICHKTLNDFALKNVDYSSSFMCTDGDYEKKTNNMFDETQKTKEEQTKWCDDENVYQPIWMFKTIGAATDIAYDDDDSLNNFNNCNNECDDTTTLDGSEWEIAQEEFLFSSNRIDTINSPISISTPAISQGSNAQINQNKYDLYRNVCILYNEVDPKWNKIIYDYNVNPIFSNCVVDEHELDSKHTHFKRTMKTVNRSKEFINCKASNTINTRNIDIKYDSVNAWKSMLRSIDYNDDEEDMVRLN